MAQLSTLGIIAFMFLFAKVEDVFEVSGKGCAVIHTPPARLPDGASITGRDYFVFRRLDGSSLRTDYTGIEFYERPGKGSAAAIMLPSRFTVRDIPIGAEIWVEKA